MARGNDLMAPHLTQRNTLAGRLLARWIEQVIRAGTRDPEIARRFIRVASLVDPPTSLLKPGTVQRVVFPRHVGATTRRQDRPLRTA